MEVSAQYNGENGNYFSEFIIPLLSIVILIVCFFDGRFLASIPPESIQDWMRIAAAIGISPIVLMGCIGIFRYLRYPKSISQSK